MFKKNTAAAMNPVDILLLILVGALGGAVLTLEFIAWRENKEMFECFYEDAVDYGGYPNPDDAAACAALDNRRAQRRRVLRHHHMDMMDYANTNKQHPTK